MASLAYTGWLFSGYPAGYTEIKYKDDRSKRNYPAPAPDEGTLSFSLYGMYEWDNAALLEYTIYGLNSSLGEGIPIDKLPTDFDNDTTCTSDIQNTIGAEVKWRGRTRPPQKPSYKIKLYYCKFENGEGEWKKKKIDEDDTSIGYTGRKTNKWTFRSDRHDNTNLYDMFSTDLFAYFGNKDDMWKKPALLKINGEELGLFMFITSPDDSILPFKDDLGHFFEVDQGTVDPITQTEAELKYPDPDDFFESPNAIDIIANFTHMLSNFRKGEADIDYQTMASRFWLQEITQDLDALNSAYFYEHTNGTIYAGPIWDAGWAFQAPIVRCEDRRVANPHGWMPDTYYALYDPFFEKNSSFLQYTIELYRNRNLSEFLANFKTEVDTLRPLIRYDWSLWKDAHQFECISAIFTVESDTKGYGGIEKWKVADIDTEIDLWLEFLEKKIQYLNVNYVEAGARKDQKPGTQWGILFVVFVSLWSVFLFLLACAVILQLLIYERRPKSNTKIGAYLG